MKQVFPERRATTSGEIRERLLARSSTTTLPFSEELLALGDSLSQRLFNDTRAQEFPEVQALAFFLRLSSLKKIRDQWLATVPQGCRSVGRGRVFHIAPANVEVMFVYSWVLSMLCGNANIVRVPSKSSPIMDTLCECLSATLQARPGLRDSQIGVQYEAALEPTQALSEIAHARVIWGGDDTVTSIRAIPSPAGLKDISFPNRFSWCALNAFAVRNLSDNALYELVTHFYNDSYLFDQRACSSPQIIAWVGETAVCDGAYARFMPKLQEILNKRGYHSDPSHTMEKLTMASVASLWATNSRLDRHSPELMSLCAPYNAQMRAYHCGGGFFYTVTLASLTELSDFAAANDQTLSHFGFSYDELTAALEAIQGRGFDRFVPVGQALAFEPIWDGMNLLSEFTRLVRLNP